MSSAGSPRCASSQSITAARPCSSTMKLPRRKSPWTRPGSAGSGALARSQRSPSSTAGSGSPISSSWRSHSSIWARAGSPSTAGTQSVDIQLRSMNGSAARAVGELGGQSRPGVARTPACAGCAGRTEVPSTKDISIAAEPRRPPAGSKTSGWGTGTPGLCSACEISANSSSIGTSETRSPPDRDAGPSARHRHSTSQVSREAPPGIGLRRRSPGSESTSAIRARTFSSVRLGQRRRQPNRALVSLSSRTRGERRQMTASRSRTARARGPGAGRGRAALPGGTSGG